MVNQAAGEAVRDEIVAKIQHALDVDGIGGRVVTEVRLTVVQSDGRVVTAIADYAYRVGDQVVFGEVKSGLSSKFSFNQKLVYAAINEGRVSITNSSVAEGLGLVGKQLLDSGKARFITHAAEGSRAARQFGRLFAGRGGSALELLGKTVTTTFRFVGSATFSTVTLFLETNSVSALGALRDDCPACSPGAISKVQ